MPSKVNPVRKNEPPKTSAALREFDSLPDAAQVNVADVARLVNASTATVWRRAKNEANFPKPRRYGKNTTRWNVGEIRAYLAGGAA